MSDHEAQTRRSVGKRGNVYEDAPEHNRQPPVSVRVKKRRRLEGSIEAAAEATDKARIAAREVDPGAPAAVDHGAPPGARNALLFHQWRKDALNDE